VALAPIAAGMIAPAPLGIEAGRRCDPCLLAGSLGTAFAVLWVLELHPSAGAVLAPLNLFTARMTASLLAAIGLTVTREAAVLAHAGGFACEIYYACTAFVPVLLLAAAIFPQPVSRRAKWMGVAIGVALLGAVNQARLVSLVWLGVHAPGLFDAAHALWWPVLLTLATIGYWIGWMKATRAKV
jgi:exosortase/archaeosortase family protein